MKRYYTCPHCQATLNPNVKIVLTSMCCHGHRGLLLLDAKPGNYELIFSEELKFESGDAIDLFCPVCSENLKSEMDESLARIDYHTEEGEEGTVSFSRKVGEHATYFITSHNEIMAYGEHAEAFETTNFFGVGRMME